MGAKLSTKLRRFAGKFADMAGVEITSVDYSALDLDIKDSPLLTVLTFGYVRGFSVDVWANGDELLNLRVKVEVQKKRQS